MAHEVLHAEVEATLPEGVRLAYDGLRLVFDENAKCKMQNAE